MVIKAGLQKKIVVLVKRNQRKSNNHAVAPNRYLQALTEVATYLNTRSKQFH